MDNEKIGGISMDKIMAAAMEGLDPQSASQAEATTFGKPAASVTPAPNSQNGMNNLGGMPAAAPDASMQQTSPRAGIGNVQTPPAPSSVPQTPQNFAKDTTNGSKPSVQNTNNPAAQGDNATGMSATYFSNSSLNEQQVQTILNYVDAGRTAEALQMAQTLVDQNMSNEVAWCVYGIAKKAWGDTALAEKAFRQSIAINPKFAWAYNELGELYGDNDDFEQAKIYLEKAVEYAPTDAAFMGDYALVLCITDSYETAIEKCKYFIDISQEKTYLQNILGQIYVFLSKEYVVDVPVDFEDPSCGTTPGFISLEDIQQVRKYCTEAKSLLTLEGFKESAELADDLLKACDDDCQLIACHKKIYTYFHAFLVFIIYTLITLFYGAPLALAIAIFTVKADKFPQYVYNYVWCVGSDDPLKYSRDSFYRNHETLKAMADGAKDGWNSAGDSSNDSLGLQILSGLFKSQVWFLKARIQFYKRWLRQRKEAKQSQIDTATVDNILNSSNNAN